TCFKFSNTANRRIVDGTAHRRAARQLPAALHPGEQQRPRGPLQVSPWSNWTWFVTEGEQEEDDFRFFGYVCGHEEEWGYFVLSELESSRGPGGLTIERDLHFTPGPFSRVIEQYRRARGQ